MTNLDATKALCNAIANTFYPDDSTLRLALFNEGIDAEGEATAKDPQIFRVALRLVMGYIEGSRSEGGISTSVRSEEAIKQSIAVWCNSYGLNAEDELTDYLRVIESGSSLW